MFCKQIFKSFGHLEFPEISEKIEDSQKSDPVVFSGDGSVFFLNFRRPQKWGISALISGILGVPGAQALSRGQETPKMADTIAEIPHFGGLPKFEGFLVIFGIENICGIYPTNVNVFGRLARRPKFRLARRPKNEAFPL